MSNHGETVGRVLFSPPVVIDPPASVTALGWTHIVAEGITA